MYVPQQEHKWVPYARSSAIVQLGDTIINICHIACQRQLKDKPFISLQYLVSIMTCWESLLNYFLPYFQWDSEGPFLHNTAFLKSNLYLV